MCGPAGRSNPARGFTIGKRGHPFWLTPFTPCDSLPKGNNILLPVFRLTGNNILAEDENPRDIRLHFEGEGTRGHTLPAHVLVKSLHNVQRILFVLAKQYLGQQLGQRARVSHEIERKYALRLHMPEEGGYALPAEIGDPSYQLFDPEEIEAVSRKFHEATHAVNAGDAVGFSNIVPDASYRRSLITLYKGLQPPKRSGLVLSLEDHRRAKIFDGAAASPAIETISRAIEQTDVYYTPSYVTGTLTEMDYVSRSVKLKLMDNRQIDVSYSDEEEIELFDLRRDLVQVHGNVTYDKDGIIKSIDSVDEILEIDETPLRISKIKTAVDTMIIEPPLEYDVSFMKDDQLYELSGDLDIFLRAETRPEIEEMLDEMLELFWADYVLEDPAKLTPAAQKLASELRKRAKKGV